MVDTLELAHNLQSELERMRAGIILMAQSLDRLHETVRLDTKCCGGIYELLVANFQQVSVIAVGTYVYYMNPYVLNVTDEPLGRQATRL